MTAEPAIDGHVERSTRIILRPLANPLPLGFLALAGGTFVLSGLQLDWIKPSEGTNVALILIGFVFPLQLLASILGFLTRDVVAGTGMGIVAGTWLSIGLIGLRSPPGSTSGALGLLLLVSALALLVPFAAALLGKLVPAGVLLLTALRYAATAIYQLDASAAWKQGAGIVGLALFALAAYTALALILEDAGGATVLPLLRRGRGRASITGNFRDQLQKIEREAGVREQL